MPSFEALIKQKSDRLEEIPLELQTIAQKQQKRILNDVIAQLDKLDKVNGQIKINSKNLKAIAEISDELKSIFLNREYLDAVKEFAKEFDVQAGVNDRLISKGFGETPNPLASESYLEIAKRNAVDALAGEPYVNISVKPIQSMLENAVVNGANIGDTIASIELFIKGDEEQASQILKYTKQITNDSFAIADRSYTSILSEELGNDWFYFSGTIVKNTRCFCRERVGNYYHYKEIESWGNGQNLGTCDNGDGTWGGEIDGTNESTIYSYLGGYNCLHSLIPVSEAIVSENDLERARSLGYIE
jgi:hypothetical protein